MCFEVLRHGGDKLPAIRFVSGPGPPKKIGRNLRGRQPPPPQNLVLSGAAFSIKKGAKLNTAGKGSGRLSPNSKQKQHERALVASRTKQVPHYAKRGAAPVIGRGRSWPPHDAGWCRISHHVARSRRPQASTGAGADSPTTNNQSCS
jgi:hypothetical protein